MQQLDSKAVWLFSVNFILRWIIYIFLLWVFYGVAVFDSYLNSGGSPELSFASLDLFIWLSSLLIPVLLILAYVISRLKYHFYYYELREDGFRKELGIIWKKYVTIPYDRIQNVDIRRGVTARILGLSDLYIQTAGGTTGGWPSEGYLPGLSREVAERIRDELIKRAGQSKNQGL